MRQSTSAAAILAAFMVPACSAAPEPYDDVRDQDLSSYDLDAELIQTLWYNQRTEWSDEDEATGAELLERGKNPGLGVRALHERGVTGWGVNVAIIDQNLCSEHHPEYAGKIAAYHDTGCDAAANEGSMHGPAVVSLLVGDTVGVAPEAQVYYVAAPSWKGDAAYFADGLNWIVEQNEELPEGEKIRVVSVSAAPSGSGSPFELNQDAWDNAVARAEAEDVLVLDCTKHHGLVLPAYYNLEDPENVEAVTLGFPGMDWAVDRPGLYVPNSYRTQAEQYENGVVGYQYTGRGGLSWAIPYAAGVLALGWQLRPELSGAEMKEILMKTGHPMGEGRVIDPQAFIAHLDAGLEGAAAD